jgi:hypothetical protein
MFKVLSTKNSWIFVLVDPEKYLLDIKEFLSLLVFRFLILLPQFKALSLSGSM